MTKKIYPLLVGIDNYPNPDHRLQGCVTDNTFKAVVTSLPLPSHYTQVVWRNTTEVGGGLARGGSNNILVCQYNPAGNVIGQPPV